MGEEGFIASNFREFYSRHRASVPAIDEREFGIGSFGSKISKRHLSFASDADLNKFLQREAPPYISYSLAYYEFPSRTPMDSKGFRGADIVYEFDADDLKTDCKQEHDSWNCPKCGKGGKGSVEFCSECGSTVLREQWFCPACLDATKKQAFRLLDFLGNDLGIAEEISVNFSGNAGYHIHLRSQLVKGLSQEARLELLDYLTAKDIDVSKLGFGESGKMFVCPLEREASGWSKRILAALKSLFEEADPEKIAAFGGISNARAKKLLENKETVLESMSGKGVLFSIEGRKNKQFWESLIGSVLEKEALDIDRQTSADIKKIIRVPDTLHGTTGLLAKSVGREELKDFNPFDDTVVFPDKTVRVFINSSPRFYLRGDWFGPFNEEESELPLFAAIYLLGRKSARLVK